MPSLALAQKLLGKASGLVPASGPVAGVSVAAPESAPESEAELGDALLALVAQARARGWDAERALRERLRALESDIRSAESR
jgi:XTP/dITP diphosphohydrolase